MSFPQALERRQQIENDIRTVYALTGKRPTYQSIADKYGLTRATAGAYVRAALNLTKGDRDPNGTATRKREPAPSAREIIGFPGGWDIRIEAWNAAMPSSAAPPPAIFHQISQAIQRLARHAYDQARRED